MSKLQQLRQGFAAGIAAAALSLVLGQVAHADPIQFDPDGLGPDPTITVSTFDYAPGNGVFAGLGPAGSPKLGQPFTYYYQAKIINFLNGSSNVIPVAGLNAPGGFEITAVFAFTGTASGNANNMVYSLTPGLNYFALFFDNNPLTQSNDLAGTGFDDSSLPGGAAILSGSFQSADGSYSIIPASPLPLFDGHGVDNYGGLRSLVSAGGADLTIGGLAIDPNFFHTLIPALQLHLANSSNVTPFDQVDPSHVFQPNIVNYTPALGAANGQGTDFQVQTDANGSFVVTPEPGSVILAGIGGLGLALMVIRRK